MEIMVPRPPRTDRRRWVAAPVAVLAVALTATVSPAVEPPPVVFEGLGLDGFEGAGSVAAALRQAGTESGESGQPPVAITGISVKGPTGREPLPVPVTAELRSRVDRFDVAAGMLADPTAGATRSARWTGRIGVANDRDDGRESIELRTTLAPGPESSLIGVALGPRVERRFGKGTTFFIDGHAEAQAVRGADAAWWSLPGTSTAELTMLGVTARTGFVR